MSLTYKILEKLVKLIRLKKIFLLPEDTILNYARKQNKKPSFKIQNEKDLYFEDKTFLSQRLIILHSKNKKYELQFYIYLAAVTLQILTRGTLLLRKKFVA